VTERPVSGVVLAAGASVRMGTAKALLTASGETFLDRAVRVLREAGCSEVVVVVNGSASVLDAADALDATVLLNADDGSEQIDSLRIAVEAVALDCTAVVVLPVDLPLIRVDTIARVVRAFRDGEGRIIVPAHAGVAGHPVAIDRDLFGELRDDLPEGLRSLLERRAADVASVAVDDAGVLIDIDTPDDYRTNVAE
jgi:CTP:molybdopterin cytidylyltransferase MocA